MFETSRAVVRVEAQRQVRQVIRLIQGGRVEIQVLDAEHHLLGAQCVVRDNAGDVVPVVFWQIDERGNVLYESQTIPMDVAGGGHGPSHIQPVLSPGRYELQLTAEGMQPESRQIEVVRGQVTRVCVVMRNP